MTQDIRTIRITAQGPAGPAGAAGSGEVFTVASQAAMLALAAHTGAIAIRSDLNTCFALAANDPAVLANWKELLTPPQAVLSVAGLTGAIDGAGLKAALAIVAGDVSGLAASATTDATDAGNIASGTLSNARLSGVALTANNLSDLASAPTAAGNLGVGSGSDVTHKTLTLAAGTIAASAPVLNATQVWNNVGAAFTAVKLNVTDTASAAASLLVDLQAGGASKFRVSKGGVATAVTGANIGNNSVTLGNDGVTSAPGVRVWNGGRYEFSSTSASNGSADLGLGRDAANVLAQVNGANAQKSNIYATYGSTTNYERLSLDAGKTTANVHRLMAEKGTVGGSLRPIAIDGYGKAGAMVAADIPAGTFALFKDTSGGGVVLGYNDGGTLMTVALT